MNLYTYVENNPLQYIDPTGNSKCAFTETAMECVGNGKGGGGGSASNSYVGSTVVRGNAYAPPPKISRVSPKVKFEVSWNEAKSFNKLNIEKALKPKGTGNGASSSIKSVDDILKGASPGRVTKGKATQYGKPGGYKHALDDFNSMGVTGVKDIPGGKVGKLPDGRTINVREKSSDGRPTLEIYDGKKSTKIRYDD
ncbi:hypothetical protein M5X17_26015 [Paenibacillus alvei]|uniref:RHS repeat-associated core domain-containing protein n=1 Tax=Paenibacillus alvei TaxID=44250 RepID=A0ABT4H7J4_PAEAL|nr:hypothetical protein [Paenibacillus alvei]EJW14603.1 hypothetical protein PAV_12c00650 [Paenibacillus alvei DSM 29]MCY9737182.1 hypothetical protein [Paenibacillus alvei]MCY9764955.1 hypothetical protein [Paenibacillus alvei]MCY9765429.1 hypothetical protein [Paenibacillus alvei]MEC0079299.1 hypothetical protein [Paenibacillus alvei]